MLMNRLQKMLIKRISKNKQNANNKSQESTLRQKPCVDKIYMWQNNNLQAWINDFSPQQGNEAEVSS